MTRALDPVRDEQLHGGFRPVRCGACTTTVLVRRSSPQQTSIQWPASAACPALLDRDASGTPVVHCASVMAAIGAAARRGDV
ncbi:hypothetical protein [Cryptosporangium phraense]|uniref:Ferredoxin n=1 Tax=Cryptosporangium phraense TaxID=2593070 RepID=A0A545B0K3_9ACTN|nr:hypothetical protein [Cryptosporangium phraense]TQS47084.1 hypothetical protein FL583_02145 [Cryptosporangium phraense]